MEQQRDGASDRGGRMYLAAGSEGRRAGEPVLTSLRSPFSFNNPVICVYYRRVADGRDKSSLFQTCSGAVSAVDRTLSPDEKTGPGKLN